jgi:Phosphotransferase system, galactitol-specific IIB component
MITKILAVCGNGLGSSLMLKINIDSVVRELAIPNVDVRHCDLTSVSGENADLVVVTKDLVSCFETSLPIIALDSIMSKAELKEKLGQFFALKQNSDD